MQTNILRTALSAVAMTVAGMAMAAGPQTDRQPTGAYAIAQSSTTQPAEPAGRASPGGTGMTGPSAAKPEVPPDEAVGKDVINGKGDKIGEVSRIVGDQVIVSVGGFLGLGAREVALPWRNLTAMGSGEKMKLQTALSKDDLKEMPEYKDPNRARSSGARPPAGRAPNGAPGGGMQDGRSGAPR